MVAFLDEEALVNDTNGPLSRTDVNNLLIFLNISLNSSIEYVFLYTMCRSFRLKPYFSLFSKIELKHIFTYFKFLLYDLDFGPLDRLLRKMRKRQVLSYIGKKRDFLILDVGCGRQVSLGWDIRSRCCAYYGLDRDIPDTSFKNLYFVKGCAERMLFPCRFDYIVALAVIEHLENPLKFLRDAHDLLSDTGELLLTTPPPVSKFILEVLSFLHLINKDEIDAHKRYFTPEDLSILLDRAGFQVIVMHKFLFGLNSFIVGRRI